MVNMIAFYLFITLASLRNLDASIFDLSKLAKGNEKSIPIIRKSTKFVRSFGAMPLNSPYPEIPVPVTLSQTGSTTPAHSGHKQAQKNPVPAAKLVENNEPAIKRPRIASEVVDESISSYINGEIVATAFKKPAKRTALQKAIEFIALNDYEGYLAYEPEFEEIFGHKYHLFKRGPNRADYMMHYIIRFGATNFLKSYAYVSRTSDDNSKIEEAFEHLIATKPLEVVLKFLSAKKHLGTESVRKAISNAIKERYPDLHFLDYFVFELNDLYDYTLKIFEAESEEDKLARLTDFLNATELNVHRVKYCIARLSEIPFRYEKYFMSLDFKLKLYFAKLAIFSENIEALSKIFELDAELGVDTSENTLFAYSVAKQNPDLIEFFMDIADELATYEEEGKLSPVAISIAEDYVDNLEAFGKCGLDLTQKIAYKGTLISPIQLAFQQTSSKSLAYLIDKFGTEYAMDQLLELYGTMNDMMCHTLRPDIRYDLAKVLRDKLGFDFNARYNFNGKTGNALVFVDEDDFLRTSFKIKFNL